MDKAAQCYGKEPFDTPALANRVMKRMANRDSDYGAVPTIYRCPQCGKWHIGNNKPRQRKLARQQFFNQGDDEE